MSDFKKIFPIDGKIIQKKVEKKYFWTILILEG